MTDRQHPAIRTLREQDLDEVAAFEVEIARISFPDDPIVDPHFHRRKLAAAVDRDGAFVARADEGLAGWAWVTERENFGSKEVYADFRSLYVAPAYRGGRVTFALARACIEFCRRRGLGRMVGRTSASNREMQAVYQILGFTARHIVYELDLPEADSAPPADPVRGGGPAGPKPARRKADGKHGRRRRGSRAP
jgi:GNAT superfamily N-acetyltransferase